MQEMHTLSANLVSHSLLALGLCSSFLFPILYPLAVYVIVILVLGFFSKTSIFGIVVIITHEKA